VQPTIRSGPVVGSMHGTYGTHETPGSNGANSETAKLALPPFPLLSGAPGLV